MALNASAPRSNSLLDRLASTSHVWVAAASVLLVILMIVPIPTWLLDLLLSMNISLALVILLTTLYTENALAFSVFPTLLLIITLFRLSLNITGTRLILLHGYAGDVIQAFGNFVVGGNYAVGLVIFSILIIIQFVVITNGAGRVAEVAARFTLDAMPGKQLAIDADLNAGLITEADARQRRKDIQRSADFYGAMDGASKFVRGDAEMAGYTVIDPTSVIATHLTEIIKGHAPDLLGRQETSALLDNVKQHYPVVVDELVPSLLTVGEIQRVLQNLLRERIPIRNLLLILENLADGARASKDTDFLTERVRAAMARHICAEYAENGLLSVITVDPRLESLLAEAVRRGEDAYALLDPGTVAKIYASLTRQMQAATQSGLAPIVLSSPSVRLALKRLTERAAPSLVVLSYSEIAPGLRVESIGQISTTDDVAEPVGAA
ncbi:MAG: hypothetical protein NVS2B17_26290 [Candidatus Velthaea sp.]